jgi:hypothetical protein
MAGNYQTGMNLLQNKRMILGAQVKKRLAPVGV